MTFRYIFPKMDEKILQNGLRIILVPDSTQDGAVAAMQMPFGRFCDPVGAEGTAELVVGMMQKGTRNLSSEAFSEKFEFRGAMLTANAGEEHTIFELRCLSSFLDELFPFFWDMIFCPAFEQNEYARYKKEVLTSLQAESVDPSFLANRHFYSELAGKQHPAGRFHSQDSIKRISSDDLKRFHKKYFGASGAVLVIAGNFDSQKFMQNHLQLLQDQNGKAEAVPVKAEPLSIPKSAFRLVDKPDLTQTTMLIGHPVPGEDNEDRNVIAIANYILGAGNFSSRLMARVRSEHGRTYSISSQIASERHFGIFLVTTATQNETAGEVFSTIKQEYEKFCSSGITQNELDKAKRFAIGNIAFQLEGIANVVEKLLWLRFYGHDNSYIEQFDRKVEELTVERVNEVIRRYFSARNLVTVMVGRKSEIRNQIGPLFSDIKDFYYRDLV